MVVVENEKELTELLSMRKLANIKFPSIRRDQKYSLVMFSMPWKEIYTSTACPLFP